jgi:hypothetical protein
VFQIQEGGAPEAAIKLVNLWKVWKAAVFPSFLSFTQIKQIRDKIEFYCIMVKNTTIHQTGTNDNY